MAHLKASIIGLLVFISIRTSHDETRKKQTVTYDASCSFTEGFELFFIALAMHLLDSRRHIRFRDGASKEEI